MSRVTAIASQKQEEQNKENNLKDVHGKKQVPLKRHHNNQSVNTSAPYSFAAEKKAYEEKREELLKEYPDKYALIKGQAIIGIFEDEYSAFTYGCDKYGNAPFLIQPVTENDVIVGTF